MEQKKYYNKKGEEILPEKLNKLIKDEFGNPPYESHLENADKYGFSKDKEVEKKMLEKGHKIARYGREGGHFSTEVGTEYEKISRPYTEDSSPYNEYRVEKETEVIAGTVASGFGQPGGGQGYYHKDSIKELCDDDVLVQTTNEGEEEDEDWNL